MTVSSSDRNDPMYELAMIIAQLSIYVMIQFNVTLRVNSAMMYVSSVGSKS